MVMVHMTTRCNSADITMHEPAGFALHLHISLHGLVVEGPRVHLRARRSDLKSVVL
jgi:hypothetical protein